MALGSNNNSLQFIKPHWPYSLVLQSSCSGEQRDAPEGVTGICSAKKKHYSLTHQISTHVCYINMPRAIASQKTSWGISSSATLLRLCSTAGVSASTLTVTHPNPKWTQHYLTCRGYVKQLRRWQSIQEKRISDFGRRIQNCSHKRQVQGSTISPCENGRLSLSIQSTLVKRSRTAVQKASPEK